ncbi:MAG TPA: ribulose-phosphate 3-epimerase [Chthonomonadaceae bacterium]|nr:ribulose-phosphate 3-epimerase [Chthonomonadaceae bacterium]
MSRVTDLVISSSLLASDFGNLAQAAREAECAGAEFLHFDVMDGRFVPNITMGPTAVKALRPISRAFFDVHLMIVEPERYLEDFVRAGANGLTVQAEACLHLQRTLAQIRELGAKAGVALNPATPPDVLEYVLGDLDLILVMTVNPGFGGQEFLPAMLPKIVRVREMIASAPNPILLEVDGGISVKTAPAVVAEGANALVAGTAIYHYPEGVAAGVRALREAAQGAMRP